MIWFLITLGFLIFLSIHLFVLFPNKREILINRYGLRKYKLGFTLVSFIGLILMLFARFYSGEFIKSANHFFLNMKDPIMYLAILLIVSADVKSNHIKYYLKHPLLIGIGIWAFAHILFNQHLNHILFFSFFLAFSIIMIIGILYRDRKKEKKNSSAKLKNTMLCFIASIVVFFVIKLSHIYIAGVAL